MMVREIKLGDESRFVKLIQQVENESDYMLFEPGERKLTIEQQRKLIEGMEREEHSTIFIAENDNKFVGYLLAKGGFAKRTTHTLYLVIGILEEYRGKGIGTMLFSEMEKWARERNIRRLELTVAAENDAGIALYKKMDFEIEGEKRDSLYIDGSYVDEYYMAKILLNNQNGVD